MMNEVQARLGVATPNFEHSFHLVNSDMFSL